MILLKNKILGLNLLKIQNSVYSIDKNKYVCYHEKVRRKSADLALRILVRTVEFCLR